MARVSFTLRRTSGSDYGSYLRYDDALVYETSGPGGTAGSAGSRLDYDSALRSDGLQLAPVEFEDSFFSGTSVCYGEVSLEWAVNIATSLSAEPQVMGIVLVYSDQGEPQTIASGQILVESSDTFSYEHTGLREGRWAYYSLFVNYRSAGGDNYFERVASLDVIVPKNYQSNLMLWNRIPEYYRVQDIALGDLEYNPCVGNTIPGVPVGPLFKMLSVIGFDIDRIRTLLDYVMVAKDPSIANTETLDALSEQMATILKSSDLGAARLRHLLADVGFFRRTKGTLSGTYLFAKAVSGCDIEIDTVNAEITVYSQRVNYITSPQDPSTIVEYRAAHVSEETTPLPFSDGTYSGSDDEIVYTGTTFTNTGDDFGIGVTDVLILVDSAIPVKREGNERVMFSVHSGVGTSGIKWVRLVNAFGTQLAIQHTPIVVDGVEVFEVTVPGASAGGWTNTYVELLVDQQAAPQFDLSSVLAERNHIGGYFDGDTVRGGWLVDSSSVSDYRWSGSANNSASIFAEDYERTKGIVQQLLFEVMPITEADKYEIVAFNAIPGF